MTKRGIERQRFPIILLAATVLCYAVGYPLAIFGHSSVGWIFVGLGGPFLIALGVSVIRRVHASAEAARSSAGDVPAGGATGRT